jgi:hypothetical protein
MKNTSIRTTSIRTLSSLTPTPHFGGGRGVPRWIAIVNYDGAKKVWSFGVSVSFLSVP